MSSSNKKILTVFGSTGNQGGSVINLILSRPDLSEKYTLRGITRSTNSSKSQALAKRGVEMVRANLDDLASLKAAIPKDSHGVFGNTDFWIHLSKDREVQQGKNIFLASQAQNVKHLVWSCLPSAEKISGGEFKGVDHFESKGLVEQFIEAENKNGGMIVSYIMPAMFIDFAKTMVHKSPQTGKPTLAFPFPSETVDIPFLDPVRDTGKYVVGLFEAAEKAKGVKLNAVSTWSTPKDVVEVLSKEAGEEVVLQLIPREVYQSFLPPNIAHELTEMFLYIGKYNYYGPGEKVKQAKYDEWLVEGAEKKISYPQWAHENGPWKW